MSQWAWLVVVFGTAAAALLSGQNHTQGLIAVTVGGVFILGLCIYLLRISNNGRQRPDGILVIGAAQLIAGITTFTTDAVTPALLVYASILTAIGVNRVVVFRTGSRAEIAERETAILAGGIGVSFFVLVIEPVNEAVNQLANTTMTITALSIGLFSILFLLWLANFDSDTISFPFILILLPQAALLLKLGDPAGYLDTDTFRVILLVTSTMPIAAFLHPRTPDLFAIAMVETSEVSPGRSLSSLAVILVGPVMVGLHQFTSLELSLTTITIASSVLSVMVAVHLLLLVRRWAAVEHQGQHDSLTGLPNRPLFFSRLEAAIEGATVRESEFVVMFLDLDRFKAVNDSLGHEKGDLLLRLVSDRLSAAATRIGSNLTVARLGGDEFAVLVPSVKDDRHAHAMGRMFLDQFLEPFDMEVQEIYMTPSIGIASFPRDGETVEQLIENADTAMFEAKERGRNTVVNYLPEQRTPGVHRLEIEAALRKALANEELEVYYQPQVDITTGQIFSVEALLRWDHPELGMISPEKFVPVAEESSLIDAIGQWTLDKACATAADWGARGLPEINVAVNLSPRQFQKSVLLTDNVARALRTSGLEPHRLELELTESLALEHPEKVNATLVHFREMGIRTAIDDFGVGHTGLDYLDRIEVDTLKIDRSFINRIGESGAPLVTAVISLAKGLNLDVIAEGVETREQVDFLKARGCRFMQGFLFSRPLSEAQLEQVLANQVAPNTTEEPLVA